MALEGSNEAEAGGLKEIDAADAEEFDKQAVYVLASKLLTKWNQLEVSTAWMHISSLCFVTNNYVA